MKIFKDKPEEILLYADAVLHGVAINEDNIEIDAEEYDQSRKKLLFTEAILIKYSNDCPERVDDGQIVKLKSGKRRLILFDDEKSIFFEIEFSDCENI
jgi:mRNA-degrading endonuclease RelE of RelBE toxin-antitoxin system